MAKEEEMGIASPDLFKNIFPTLIGVNISSHLPAKFKENFMLRNSFDYLAIGCKLRTITSYCPEFEWGNLDVKKVKPLLETAGDFLFLGTTQNIFNSK